MICHLKTIKPFALKKEEILRHKKQINQLFTLGKIIYTRHVRVYHLLCTLQQLKYHKQSTCPLQALFVVPKKNIKRAVERNRIRRKMKEAYRLCRKKLFTLIPDDQILLQAYVYQYRSKEKVKKGNLTIHCSIKKLLEKLAKQYGLEKGTNKGSDMTLVKDETEII